MSDRTDVESVIENEDVEENGFSRTSSPNGSVKDAATYKPRKVEKVEKVEKIKEPEKPKKQEEKKRSATYPAATAPPNSSKVQLDLSRPNRFIEALHSQSNLFWKEHMV